MIFLIVRKITAAPITYHPIGPIFGAIFPSSKLIASEMSANAQRLAIEIGWLSSTIYFEPRTLTSTAMSTPTVTTRTRQILFPTDFSATSQHAFEYALDMAAHIGARVLMFHSYFEAPTSKGVAPPAFLDKLRSEKEDNAMRGFRRYESEAQARTGGEVELVPLIESGRTVEQILAVSRQEQVDMIVMGTKGAASVSEKIFGSLTTRVIEGADCPVLAVPEGVSFQPIQHILYASNFEDHDFAILDQLLEYADLFGAKLSCAHIYAGEDYWSRLDRGFFERLYQLERERDQLHFFTFNYRDVAAGLNRFIASNKVDLLAMMTHKRDPLRQVLGESVTRDMTLMAEVPLLAFHCP